MDELTPIVSVDWLTANLENVTPVDCTWAVTQDMGALPEGFIPGALEFDLAAIKKTPLEQQTTGFIAAAISKLGIEASDTLIVYDRLGLFSAPRLWWLLKTMGHKDVAVLDGGLPAWIEAGHPLQPRPDKRGATHYIPITSLYTGSTLNDVLTTSAQIVDARSEGRFTGQDPEPRAGLRSGHIPGAVNLPFGKVFPGGYIAGKNALTQFIADAGIDLSRPVITSCGSGVTAAGLALAFATLRKTDISVYTGSWAEYGATEHPVEAGP